jgi:hypothetical protein
VKECLPQKIQQQHLQHRPQKIQEPPPLRHPVLAADPRRILSGDPARVRMPPRALWSPQALSARYLPLDDAPPQVLSATWRRPVGAGERSARCRLAALMRQ